MPTFTRFISGLRSTAVEFDETDADIWWDNQPEDRVGPPPSRPKSKLRSLALVAVLAGGWAYADPASMTAAYSFASDHLAELASSYAGVDSSTQPTAPVAAAPSGEKQADRLAEEPPPAAATIDQEAPSETAAHAPTGGDARSGDGANALGDDPAAEAPEALERKTPDEPQKTATIAAAAVATAAVSRAGVAYQPPPAATAAGRQGRTSAGTSARAAAAGLHPDLSDVLLSRLTPADFANAAKAIRTALAEKSDDGVHSWPRRAAKGEAVFEVHFVAGAGPGCRRYVVSIAKDGWLTTALPMEKCAIGGGRLTGRTKG